MKRLLLLFLLLASSTLNAATTPSLVWYNLTGAQWSSATAANNFSTKIAVCQKYASGLNAAIVVSSVTVNSAGTACAVVGKQSGYPEQTYTPQIFPVYACPTGTTQVGSGTPTAATVCTLPTCPSGQVWSTVVNACASDCNLYKGQQVSIDVNCSATNAPSIVCMPNNCQAQLTGSATGFDKVKSCYFGYAYGKHNGILCSGQPNATNFSNPTAAPVQPDPSPETDCIKQGKTFGNVNGVIVCVSKASAGGNPTTTKDESTTQTKDKDAAGNETEKASNTEVTVKKDGNNVEVTTKTKNSDGTEKEETTTQTYDTFCSKNPNDKLCKSPEENKDPSCEENPDLPQCMDLGQPSDTDVIGTETRTVTFSPVQITSGGSCPPDKSITVAGRAHTFSYSWLCEYASSFKPFMLAFAYLSAGMFLFWGYKGAQT